MEIPTEDEAVAYRDGVLVTSAAGTVRFMSQKNYSTLVAEVRKAEGELPADAVAVNNKGWILAFTDRGNAARLDIGSAQEKRWKEKAATLSQFNPEIHIDEKPVKIMFFPSAPVGEVIIYTEKGMVKRTELAEFGSMRGAGTAMALSDGDRVIGVEVVEEGKNVLEVTRDGLCLVYATNEVPVQGRKASGVRGIKLNDGDAVAYAGQADDEGEIIVMATTGHLKRVISSTIDPGSRYNKGVKLIDLAGGKVCFAGTVKMPYDLYVVTPAGAEVVNTEDIRLDTRVTKGRQAFKAGIVGAYKIIGQ